MSIRERARQLTQLNVEKRELLDDPYVGVDFKTAKTLELCKNHRESARIAAEKSVVLLKNEEPLADAILYAWMPGTEGGNAIANLK